MEAYSIPFEIFNSRKTSVLERRHPCRLFADSPEAKRHRASYAHRSHYSPPAKLPGHGPRMLRCQRPHQGRPAIAV